MEQLRGYLLKEFKSPIVNNTIDYGATHFGQDSILGEFSSDAKVYPDGIITVVNSVSGCLSISVNRGLSWINNVLSLSMKNVKRVDKETFIFEIIVGIGTQFAVTFDMFMTYTVIPIGSDNDAIRVQDKIEIINKPYAFIRDSLYSFNEDSKTYTKIYGSVTQYYKLADSNDCKSVYMLCPGLPGYSVVIFDTLNSDSYRVLYNVINNGGSWDGSILSFNTIKYVDGSDAFIITTLSFNNQIDIPSINVYSTISPPTSYVGFSI